MPDQLPVPSAEEAKKFKSSASSSGSTGGSSLPVPSAADIQKFKSSTAQKKNPIPAAGASASVVTKPSSVSNQPAKPAPSASSSAAPKPVSVIPGKSQGKLLMVQPKKTAGEAALEASEAKRDVFSPNFYGGPATKKQPTQAPAPKKVGALEDIGNTFMSSVNRFASGIAGIPNMGQQAALMLATKMYGIDDEYNALPVAAKKELGNVLSAVSVGSSIPSPALSRQAQEYFIKKSDEFLENTNKSDKFLNERIGDFYKAPSVEKATDLFLEIPKGFAGSLPYMINPMAGAVSAASEQYNKDIQEADGKLGWGQLLNAGVTGVSEFYIERLSNQILNKSIKQAINSPKVAKDLAEGFVKSVLKDVGMEGAGEGLTEFVQSVSDDITKGRDIDWVKTANQTLDAAITGSGIAGGMRTTGAGVGYLSKKVMSAVDKKKLDKNTAAIMDLNTKKGPDNSPEVNAVINSKINELNDQNKNIINSNVDKVKSLSDAQIQEIVKIDSDIQTINKNRDAIVADPNLNDTEKQSLLDHLRSQAATLTERKTAVENQKALTAESFPKPDEFGTVTFEFPSEKDIPSELKGLTPTGRGSASDEKGNRKIFLSFSQEQIDPIIDAIQKQTTSQVPVQPEAGTSLQVAEGEPQAEPQVPTQEGQREEIERRRQEELSPYASQTTVSEETFEGLDPEGNPVVYVVRTMADGSRQVRLQLTTDGKVETFPIGKAGKDITFSNAELIEKSYASEPKSISINNNPINPTKINKINEKYDAELAALEQPTTQEGQGQEVTPTEEEFVYETNPENKNQWVGDFEIIDNRGGKADLEINGREGNWYVANNVTGRLMMARSKSDAQNIINDADSYDFGQGETFTRPVQAQPVQKTAPVSKIGEVTDEGAKQEKINLDEEVSLLEQLLEQEETAPTQSAGISISSDTDIEELRNRSQSRSQKATTQEEKDSANTRVKIIDTAKKAIKTLKSIFPDVDIVIHDDEGSYNAAMSEVNGVSGSRGNFFIDTTPDGKTTGRIDINLTKANSRTVAHEIAHGILLKTFGDNKNLFNDFRTRLSKVIKSDVNQQLNDFANQYVDPATGELLDVNHEEFLAELTGILQQQETKVSVTTMQKLAALINEFVSKITNGKFKPFEDTKNTKDVVDFFNNISSTIREGGEIQELNGGGEVGTFNFTSRSSLDAKEAPSVANDSRSFIRDLVEDVDMIDFNGRKFVTNMYDYTTAGTTDLGNGLTINMLGGKNYVPYMMSLQDKKIGDVSNLAAFNTKAQAESFARNAINGDASLFAPHSGTLSESWQFQQHTFAELVNLILDKNIMSNTELIDLFNKTISSEASKKAFNAFKSKYGKNISNFNSFKNNPKKIVELLDIKNNYSPNLRKALNNAISADKTFQKAIGVKNKEEFFKRIMDPLNDGVQGGEIINLVEFDPKTFQIVQTKPGSLDHHPSFGWAILSKINGIYQPTKFYQSSNVTESYVKYNKSGEQVSRKAEESNFDKKNVSSSAGSIPKVAEFIEQSEVKSRSQLPSNDAQKIVNLGRANGFSDQAISNVLEKRGFTQGAIDIALGNKPFSAEEGAPTVPFTKEEKKSPLSSIPGYERMMGEVDGIIEKSFKRGVSFDKTMDNAMQYMSKSKVYEDANDTQREEMVREVRKMFNKKEKKAPSVKKLGLKEPAKKTLVDTKKLLDERLVEIDQSIKEGQRNFKQAVKEMATEIKAMLPKGMFSKAQVSTITNALATNLLNPKLREAAIEKVNRIVNNVEYATKLKNAYDIKAAIRKTLKTGKEIIDVEKTVRNFLKIDPRLVSDLEQYVERANEVFEAIRNVRVKGDDVIGRSAMILADINAYADKQNEIQDEINKNSLLDRYDNLVQEGKISGDMSLNDIKKYIASIEEDPKKANAKKSEKVREFTKEAFADLSDTVKQMIEDGEIDKEDVDFDMVSKFADMDIEALTIDQQLNAVDSLDNFVVNGVTSRMGAILQAYTGVTNSAKDAGSGMKARPLSYGLIGRLAYLRKITTKGLMGNLLGGVAAIGDLYNNLSAIYISKTESLITGLFRSTGMAIKFMKNSGFSGIVRGFVQGKKIANDFAKKYADKFEKLKPNGKAFNDASNVFERGIFADLSRNIKNGTPDQIKTEFDRRMKQLRLTIETLRATGKKQLVDKANLYDGVYQKVKNAENIEEVKLNIDPINQEAVKDFQDMWRKYYSEFKKMAADYYNIILDEDVNYSPDMYEKLAEELSDDLITKGAFKMAFDVVSTEEVGTLKRNQRIDGLPISDKTKEINRVRDYDFDFNNINALEKTLIDVRTTPYVQQFEGYTNSPSFKEIFPDFDDRQMVKKRLNFNINSLRERQDTYSSDTARKINRFVTALSKYGTRIGLGSLSAAPKQSIPMMGNTMINLINDLGSFGMGVADFWNKDAMDFLENSGYGISLRGAESQTSIDFAEKLIDRANQGKVGDLSESLSKLGDMYIEKFLKNPDVTVANMAWLAYYRNKLKSMGVDMNTFDWKNHELNEEAADYAEFKVQDQQNMNISELGGKLLASKDATTKTIRQLLFPFASYQFNLKDKNNRNITMLTSKTSTNQEKVNAAKSLAAGLVESYMFQTIQASIGVLLLKAAYAAIGYEEPEEEKTTGIWDAIKKAMPFVRTTSPTEKFNDSIFVGKSIFEFVAPIPPQLEYLTMLGLNDLLDVIEGGTPEEQLKEKKKKEKESEISVTGRKIKKRRKLAFGQIPEDKEAIKIKEKMEQPFRFFAREELPYTQVIGDIVGGVPAVGLEALLDFKSRTNEAYSGSFKDKYGEYEYSEEQKKILKQSLIPRAMVAFNIAPREFLTISNNIVKAVNKKAKEDAKEKKKQETKKFRF
jgi:hypothetical protein